MKNARSWLLALSVMCATTAAETVTLQEGVNDYVGFEDVTIFQSAKNQSYSWFEYGDNVGGPQDEELVFNDFCC